MAGGVDALKSSYDAVIVGARCAGAATAMLLARAGLDVLVIEQGAPGADALSTLALMRAGVLQLSRWGLLDQIRAAGTPRIEKTTFHYDDRAVEIRIKPRDGVDALYAPRRTVLDPLLADAAQAAGAEVVYRVRVTELQRDGQERVTGVVVESGSVARTIAATMVIGSDGIHSTVAKRVGAAPYLVGSHMSSVIYTRARGLDMEGYHWHYAPGVSVGVIPTNDGETVVFVAAPQQRFMRELRFDLAAGFQKVLQETSPALGRVMRRTAAGSFRGFAGHRAFLRPAWGPGWALVGDAGYFKDPITAHGITDALRDAELLARAVLRGTDEALVGYQTVRDQLSARLLTITDEIASFAWDLPRLQVLHKSLSDEMSREVGHVLDGGAESAAVGHTHGGARASVQPAHGRLQPATR
jgi:2-polyprenyl-6-methoxyphenol hydroxylase-like FAD-dependent oxidoreductase